MITIAINNSDGRYEAPDSAIAQLEAHETITGAKGVGTEANMLFSIPFHAIDHVTVERTPITPVTPSDDLCGGGGCDGFVWMYSGDAAPRPIDPNDPPFINSAIEILAYQGEDYIPITESVASEPTYVEFETFEDRFYVNNTQVSPTDTTVTITLTAGSCTYSFPVVVKGE